MCQYVMVADLGDKVVVTDAPANAVVVHRQLARLFEDRGVRIDQTYQLNFGGNMDFKNMLERERLQPKKVSKTR